MRYNVLVGEAKYQAEGIFIDGYVPLPMDGVWGDVGIKGCHVCLVYQYTTYAHASGTAMDCIYHRMRALKHDMGNHISVLENLLMKNETDEADKYLKELKLSWYENVAEIKTGNPVTDVLLMQKQKEAAEKRIAFGCDFIYPTDTHINAFDVSVILNNAIENAFEGSADCESPYVSISSCRKKNAYLIEVRNNISVQVEMDGETGLPETTKEDRSNHGFGLANIRRVAQKYHGDIDISQNEKGFTLTVMLIIE